MSKKDFVLIAETLNAYEFTDPQDKVNLANQFADALRGTNYRFDRFRFVRAVTLGEFYKTKGHHSSK